MRQTILTVVLEVQPQSKPQLIDLIEQLRAPGSTVTARLQSAVPALHFMSMIVFEDNQYDPILMIEANFDGPAGPFWAQLEAAIEPELRPMLRCCKPPTDEMRELYDAVTDENSRYPIAPYLEKKTVFPAASHSGNRGLDRDRILREGDLFVAARAELGRSPSPYHGLGANQLHQALRNALLPHFSWLDEPSPVRIAKSERTGDRLKLIGFLLVVVFVLSIPGVLIAPITPTKRFLVVVAIATALAGAQLSRLLEPLRGQGTVELRLAHLMTFLLGLGALLIVYLLVISVVATPAVAALTGLSLVDSFEETVEAVGLGVWSVPFTTMVVLVVVRRRLESRDSSQDAPPIDPDVMREMAAREDRAVQNHMGSLVLVKAGLLRAILIRAGLWGLGLVVRVTATDGYLGSMRTIHFAHWALVNNGSRLLFVSNFDGSWESYLDDFIEKAHGGLSLAWCNGVGFPPVRFLIFDGASHGRRFKDWARHSMALNRFWFSAYENYTVNQIERQARIADGLRRRSLSAAEASAWAADL
jgi:hypothetical protein